MDQEDSRRAQQEEIDELRQRLNEEIEKEDFDLSAPSVVKISIELDNYFVDHYHKS